MHIPEGTQFKQSNVNYNGIIAIPLVRSDISLYDEEVLSVFNV
jgi:hypothetical protein